MLTELHENNNNLPILGMRFESNDSIYEVIGVSDTRTMITCKVILKESSEEYTTTIHFEECLNTSQELIEDFKRNGFKVME